MKLAKNKYITSKSGFIVACLLMLACALSHAKDVPQTYSQQQIETFYQELNNRVAEGNSEGTKEAFSAYLQNLTNERVKQYEGSIIRVTSKEAEASMSTKVNLATERKRIPFSIKPPFDGLEVHDYAKLPTVTIKRGNASRVEKHKSILHVNTGVVDFSLTLVEPNLAEKNVHVVYSGWADYRYTRNAAAAAAERDLEPIRAYAAKIIADADARKSVAMEAAAKGTAKDASDTRRSETQVEAPVNPTFSKDEDGPITDVFLLGLLSTIPVIFTGVVTHRLNKFGDDFIRKRYHIKKSTT